MIADKTDNVEVVVALDGTPIDDEDDIGNEWDWVSCQNKTFAQDHVWWGEQGCASLYQ